MCSMGLVEKNVLDFIEKILFYFFFIEFLMKIMALKFKSKN